ncbi:MAG TPA: hypothetical protein ENG44_03335 [Desulfurococcaceae archaeon]|nr:hypothetical protein [Desulfurococcaceae archaeon]
MLAPSEVGKYLITATLKSTNITSSAALNVIEVIRSIQLELLNDTVPLSGKAYAKVRVSPSPSKALQVQLVININNTWMPTAFGIIDTSGETIVTFTAPNVEGEYGVKAIIPEVNVESNTVMLKVIPPTKPLIPQEFLYAVIAVAVIAGVGLYILGRRRAR